VPRFGGNYRLLHFVIFQAGALVVMDDMRGDHGLTVTGEGQDLMGDAGAVLLRKLADPYGQADLKDAEPDTLRYRLFSLPARLGCHARAC
jgi:hypothetical protein